VIEVDATSFDVRFDFHSSPISPFDVV
jgi:hypothetical protein